MLSSEVPRLVNIPWRVRHALSYIVLWKILFFLSSMGVSPKAVIDDTGLKSGGNFPGAVGAQPLPVPLPDGCVGFIAAALSLAIAVDDPGGADETLAVPCLRCWDGGCTGPSNPLFFPLSNSESSEISFSSNDGNSFIV